MSESLAGRFELTFAPHRGFHESAAEFNYTLDDWLRWGGYPGAKPFRSDEARWRSYVTQSIVDAVIGLDIIMQKIALNHTLIRQAFAIACGNSAREISYAKLLGQLQDSGNTDLVKSCLEIYQAAFLLFSLRKYSRNPRIAKSSSPKLLMACPALAILALGTEAVLQPEKKAIPCFITPENYEIFSDNPLKFLKEMLE